MAGPLPPNWKPGDPCPWCWVVLIACVIGFFTVLLPLFVWMLAWGVELIDKYGLPLWSVLPWPHHFR